MFGDFKTVFLCFWTTTATERPAPLNALRPKYDHDPKKHMYAYSFLWKELIEGKRSAFLHALFYSYWHYSNHSFYLFSQYRYFSLNVTMRNLPIPHCFNNGKFIIIAFANVANVWPHSPPEGAATRRPLQVELGWEQMQHTLLWLTWFWSAHQWFVSEVEVVVYLEEGEGVGRLLHIGYVCTYVPLWRLLFSSSYCSGAGTETREFGSRIQ